MATLTLEEIAGEMKDIDVCMLGTLSAAGDYQSRPMSNNRQVEYEGNSYFFANGGCSAVRDIQAHPGVMMAFVKEHTLIGKNLYLSVTGVGSVTTDEGELKKHWTKDVALYFEKGIDTPGLTLIRVKATKIRWWKGMENGVVQV